MQGVTSGGQSRRWGICLLQPQRATLYFRFQAQEQAKSVVCFNCRLAYEFVQFSAVHGATFVIHRCVHVECLSRWFQKLVNVHNRGRLSKEKQRASPCVTEISKYICQHATKVAKIQHSVRVLGRDILWTYGELNPGPFIKLFSLTVIRCETKI